MIFNIIGLLVNEIRLSSTIGTIFSVNNAILTVEHLIYPKS